MGEGASPAGDDDALLRRELRRGAIPVEVRLAADEVADVSPPPPLFALVPRSAYLPIWHDGPVGDDDAVDVPTPRTHFAPHLAPGREMGREMSPRRRHIHRVVVSDRPVVPDGQVRGSWHEREEGRGRGHVRDLVRGEAHLHRDGAPAQLPAQQRVIVTRGRSSLAHGPTPRGRRRAVPTVGASRTRRDPVAGRIRARRPSPRTPPAPTDAPDSPTRGSPSWC